MQSWTGSAFSLQISAGQTGVMFSLVCATKPDMRSRTCVDCRYARFARVDTGTGAVYGSSISHTRSLSVTTVLHPRDQGRIKPHISTADPGRRWPVSSQTRKPCGAACQFCAGSAAKVSSSQGPGRCFQECSCIRGWTQKRKRRHGPLRSRCTCSYAAGRRGSSCAPSAGSSTEAARSSRAGRTSPSSTSTRRRLSTPWRTPCGCTT